MSEQIAAGIYGALMFGVDALAAWMCSRAGGDFWHWLVVFVGANVHANLYLHKLRYHKEESR